jgi:hypothetical protein
MLACDFSISRNGNMLGPTIPQPSHPLSPPNAAAHILGRRLRPHNFAKVDIPTDLDHLEW